MATPTMNRAETWVDPDHNLFQGRIYLDRSGHRRHAYAGITKLPAIIDGALELSGYYGAYLTNTSVGNVTGDLDVRALVNATPWSASTGYFAAKYNGSGNYGWRFGISAGCFYLSISVDGINPFSISSDSHGIAEGETKYIRFTRVASTGLVTFYSSNDGTTWIQVGTTKSTTAGTLYASTDPLKVGYFGGNAGAYTGQIYHVEVRDGIDGPITASPDFTSKPDGLSGFLDIQNNSWTIFGCPGSIGGSSFNQSSAAGSFVACPATSAFDWTNGLDIRLRLALTDFTPGSSTFLAGQYNSNAGQRGWHISLLPGGNISFKDSLDGSNDYYNNTVGSALPATDGTYIYLRLTFEPNVSGNAQVTTYWAPDSEQMPISWTSLGSINSKAAHSPFNAAYPLAIGAFATGLAPSAGQFKRVQVRNNALDNGSGIVADVDFSLLTDQTTEFTDAQNNVWRVVNPVGTASDPQYLPAESKRYMYFPQVSGNFVCTPVNPPLSLSGQAFSIESDIRPIDWTPGANCAIGGFGSDITANKRMFDLLLVGSGKLTVKIYDAAGAQIGTDYSSPLSVPIPDGGRCSVKAGFLGDNGSGNSQVAFFYSLDKTNWLPLGTMTQSIVTTMAMTMTSGNAQIGRASGGNYFLGTIYHLTVRDGVGGPVIWDVDTSMANDAICPALVGPSCVVSRSPSNRKLVMVEPGTSCCLLGNDDCLMMNDAAALNFDVSDSFSVAAAYKVYGTPAISYPVIFSKKTGLSTSPGWTLAVNASVSPARHGMWLANGSTNPASDFPTQTAPGMRHILAGIRNIATPLQRAYRDGSEGTTPYTTGSIDTRNTNPIYIGRDGGGSYIDMEWFGSAIWSEALSVSDVARLNSEMFPNDKYIKVWDGSVWIGKPVKVWDGISWLQKPIKKVGA